MNKAEADCQTHTTWWALLMVMVATAVISYAVGLGATAPSDVLKEVRKLDAKVQRLTVIVEDLKIHVDDKEITKEDQEI